MRPRTLGTLLGSLWVFSAWGAALAQPTGGAPAAASAAPSAAASAAPAPPTAPPSGPACAREPWTLPAETEPATDVLVRHGDFELTRQAAPPSAPGADTEACLWLLPAAQGDGGLAAEGAAPKRPPTEHRFQRLRVTPCPETSEGACAHLAGLKLPLTEVPGRIPAALWLPGEPPRRVLLHAPPDRWLLFGALLVGLLGAYLVTSYADRLRALATARRRLRHLEARAGTSGEDFPPILHRIEGVLDELRTEVERGPTLLRALAFAPRATDDRLLEGEQLLDLSDYKTRLWHRSQTMDLAPSLQARVSEALRQFDDALFQLALPLPDTAGKAVQDWPGLPDLLKEAEGFMVQEDVRKDFAENLIGALRAALKRDRTDTPLPRVAEAGDAVASRVAALADHESGPAGFGRFADRDFAAQPPTRRELREIDARLNVWRGAIAYLDRRLVSGAAAAARHEEADADRLLIDAIDRWMVKDLTAPLSGRPDYALLSQLVWRAENERDAARIAELCKRPDGISLRGPGRWRAGDALTLELRPVDHALGRTFFWRNRLGVRWTTSDSKAKFMAAPIRMVTVQADASEAGDAAAQTRGPRVTLIPRTEGTLNVTAELATQAGPRTFSASVRIEKNTDVGLFGVVQSLQTLNALRILLSAVLAVCTGMVYADRLFALAQGWGVYVAAFGYAFSVDLSTMAARAGYAVLLEKLKVVAPNALDGARG